jgi:hypothetical protein
MTDRSTAERSPVERVPAVHLAVPPAGRGGDLDKTISENSSAFDATEDNRLKNETEQASLTVARSYMPAPLFGSHASLERQNDRLEAEGLSRIEDERELAARISNHLLVPVPVSAGLSINGNLAVNHRYCRPWTARFLSDLATAYEAEFHQSFEVSSAVRTVEYQKRLMQVNGNAAPAVGEVVSPHLTGAAVDIAKDNLSRAEMAWMRRHLLALEAAGKIDVEEEFQQSCFHISVYKSYLPTAPRTTPSVANGRSQKHKGTKGGAVQPPASEGAPAEGF